MCQNVVASSPTCARLARRAQCWRPEPGGHRRSARGASLGVRCIFGKLQFQPALATALLGGTATFAELNPLGASAPAGPNAYPELMERPVEALAACLAGAD